MKKGQAMLDVDQLYSEPAEQSLIGAILIDPGSWGLVSGLPSGSFFLDRHKILWKAIRRLKEKNQPVDNISLHDYLLKENKLDEVGGDAYITHLIGTTVSSLNVETYMQIIAVFQRRRQLVDYAGQLAAAAYNENDDSLEISALEIARRVLEQAQLDNHLHHWSTEITAMIDQVSEVRLNPREVWGISTGFEPIDAFSGGLHKHETFWIAGMPGIGKSILAAQLGIMSVMPGLPDQRKAKGVALFVLENTTQLTTTRMISGLAKIATLRFLTGFLTDDDYQQFLETAGDASNLPVYHRERSLTVPEFRAECIRAKQLHNVEVVVLDYLYMMRAYGLSSKDDRTEIISGETVQVMKDEGLAGIFVNSVTKEGFSENGGGMADMRGSGQQMHDADTAAFLLPVKGEKDLRRLKYVKGRNLPGSLANIALQKAEQYPWFIPAKSTTIDLNARADASDYDYSRMQD